MGTASEDRLAKQSYMNWDATLAIARDRLGSSEPQDIAQRAGVRYDAVAGEFVVPYLGQEHRVRHPSGEVYLPQGGDVQIPNKILILHYLESADGVPLCHRWISFKEIPCGQIYFKSFYSRAIQPLIKFFGRDSQLMIAAGLALGGSRDELGDVCIVAPVLPMVPLACVIWNGDEEFEASGNILFDESVSHYLPLEDCAVVAGMVVYALKKQLDRPAETDTF